MAGDEKLVSASGPANRGNDPLELAWRRHKQGDLAFAYEAYRGLLRQNPENPRILHYLGLIAQQTGHGEEAMRLLRQSLALHPHNSEALDHLGQILAQRQEWAQAAEAFERAIDLGGRTPAVLNNLANVRVKLGQTSAARALYEEAIALDPDHGLSHYNLGKLLRDLRGFSDARQAYQRAVDADPRSHQAHYELALCLEEAGDFGRATHHYLEAVGLREGHARAIANLLSLPSFDPSPELIEQALLTSERANATDLVRAKLHQGLGKYLDRKGEFPAAFEHFLKSNAAQRRVSGGACETFNAAAEIRRFARARLPEQSAGSDFSQKPIFIVGMPRSGTTLVEQMLSSHPDVFGAGELGLIPRLAGDHASHSAPELRKAAAAYLDGLHALAPPSVKHVTDKYPFNYRYLGFIVSLFPGARIIHCRRDARDVLVSCFVELFNPERVELTSAAGIVGLIREEAELMEHWRRVLPVKPHEVRYEDLVKEPRPEVEAMLRYCSLSWHESCLDFTANERFVDTPSRWQVRQPLNTQSIGRWRNYAQQLAGPLDVLEKAGLIQPS